MAQLGISWRLGQSSDLLAQLLQINGSLLGAKLAPLGKQFTPFTLSALGGLHIGELPALQCRCELLLQISPGLTQLLQAAGTARTNLEHKIT